MACGHWDDSDAALLADARQRIGVLTRLLCYSRQVLRDNHIELTGELLDWSSEHDRKDRLRLEREKKEQERQDRAKYLAGVRQRLIANLYPDEREAMGL